MEKFCEFCVELRPVIYCKADAAYLCLSCDAKVHSANAISNRHLRTLLCDSCRNHPAFAVCFDHRMLVCRVCDQSIHGVSSQHQKSNVSCYTGCPSAKDFAALLGFEFDELDKSAIRDQLISASASVQPSFPVLGIARESCNKIGSFSRTSKISGKGQQQQNNGSILQQILDVIRLQLTEMDNSSLVICGQEEMDITSSMFETFEKLNDNVDHFQLSQDPLQDLKVDSLPPFSQPGNLPLSSTDANPSLRESFWQCKNPVRSSQLWSQNMQDLGVCEDSVSHDDFNIPDVDITFRNIEELFGTKQNSLFDDKDATCYSMEHMSLDTSQTRNVRTKEDTSVASSPYISHPVHMDNDNGLNQVYDLLGSLHSSRATYSAMPHSISWLSTESSGTQYLDSVLSPRVTGGEVPCASPGIECAHSEIKENAVTRYKVKQKARVRQVLN